ncbi:MAG: FKBP-type peptidyl-prolyl cis-trans isomerase [Bacteroidota bacterium]|nr:FKBP-type peptidyl-prolyl cis-trans isomerase [Bacteroidota bacterium]
MKKYLLALVAIFLFTTGCTKEDEDDHMDVDRETIEKYLEDNSIEATQHESGIYYVISKTGSGNHPNSNSYITIRYKGQLLDGTVFDETTADAVTFKLKNLIKGWQYGIPLIKTGGKITLYIPSKLGYGSQSTLFIK